MICAALFQTGRFNANDARYVWIILAGSTVGLLAATMGRLYSSAFYALRDTRTPLRYAVIRVALTAVLGVFCGLYLPGLLGLDRRYGAAGLTASAGVAAWIEFALLRRGIARRIGACHVAKGVLPRLWISAALATAVALGIKLPMLPATLHPDPARAAGAHAVRRHIHRGYASAGGGGSLPGAPPRPAPVATLTSVTASRRRSRPGRPECCIAARRR